MLTTTALLLVTLAAEPPVNTQQLAASHLGYHRGDHIVWVSTYVVPATIVAGRQQVHLPLAFPLAATTLFTAQDDWREQRDEHNQVVALEVQEQAFSGIFVTPREMVRRLRIESKQVLAEETGEVALAPPLLLGNAVQKIVLEDDHDLTFESSPELRVVRHVTHLATEDVSHIRRRQAEKLLNDGANPADRLSIYFVLNQRIVDSRGLEGTIVSRMQHRRAVAIGAAGAGGLLALLLVFGYVQLTKRARRDQVRQQLDQKLSRLDLELEQIDSTINKLEPQSDSKT